MTTNDDRLGTEDPAPFAPTADNIAPWESIEDYGWMMNSNVRTWFHTSSANRIRANAATGDWLDRASAEVLARKLETRNNSTNGLRNSLAPATVTGMTTTVSTLIDLIANALWAQASIDLADLSRDQSEAIYECAVLEGADQAVEAWLEGDIG